MKKIINNILFKFKEDSLVKKRRPESRAVVYKTLEEIKTCLVFWSADFDPQLCLKKLSKKIEGGVFDTLCIVSEGEDTPSCMGTVILKNEELGFRGKIQNDHLYAMMAKKYDLLIDLTANSSAMVQYVLTNSNACCISSMKKADSVADIIIGDAKDAEEFMDKLIELLARINKL